MSDMKKTSIRCYKSCLVIVETFIKIGISFWGEQSPVMNPGSKTWLNLEMRSIKQIAYSRKKISFLASLKILSSDWARYGTKLLAQKVRASLGSGESNSYFLPMTRPTAICMCNSMMTVKSAKPLKFSVSHPCLKQLIRSQVPYLMI